MRDGYYLQVARGFDERILALHEEIISLKKSKKHNLLSVQKVCLSEHGSHKDDGNLPRHCVRCGAHMETKYEPV